MSKSQRVKRSSQSGIKWVIGCVVAIALLIGGVVYISGGNQASEIVASSQVKVQVTESSYDWGTIQMQAGKAVARFDIQNAGSEVLQLFNLASSCTCTTARLILGDERSPAFSMHTKSRYVFEVPPGETAQLEVEFDPAFHGPGGVGPITRQVTVATNDASQPELQFTTTANVIR